MVGGQGPIFKIAERLELLRPAVVTVGQHIGEILSELDQPFTPGLLVPFGVESATPGWRVHEIASKTPIPMDRSEAPYDYAPVGEWHERHMLYIAPTEGLVTCSIGGMSWERPKLTQHKLNACRLGLYDALISQRAYGAEAQAFQTLKVVSGVEAFVATYGLGVALRKPRSI